MITVVADDEHVSLKVAGNLTDLLTDASHISNSIAQTLLECASEEIRLAVICCIQHIFSDAVSFALSSALHSNSSNGKESSSTDDEDHINFAGVSGIKVDLAALHEWLQNNQHSDTENEEDNDE